MTKLLRCKQYKTYIIWGCRIIMPIDADFPRNHKVIGKHSHSDGEHFHFVWGPGRPEKRMVTGSNIQIFKSLDIKFSKYFRFNLINF